MQGKFTENYVQSIVALLNSNDEHLRAGAAHAVAYIVDNNCTFSFLFCGANQPPSSNSTFI